jgi:tetratricopeptide (TPR) repeat protein
VRRAGETRDDARRMLVEAVAAVYPIEEVFKDSKTWPRARQLDGLALALVGGDSAPQKGREERTAALLNALAQYRHAAFAAYASARPLCVRALAIREKVLGPEHPDTAESLNNLAFLFQNQDDLAGARPLYERALAIYEKALGPEHPHTAEVLNNLASLLWVQGDLAGRGRSTSARWRSARRCSARGLPSA